MRILLILLSILFPLTASFAQVKVVTVSGVVKEKVTNQALPFVNVVLKIAADSAFVMGTVTNEEGRFALANISPGNYALETSMVGFNTNKQTLYVGSISPFLDIATIELAPNAQALQEVLVTGQADAVSEKMEKKTFSVADNISQSGGSVLQTMQNLPGVTVQDGKVQLRGNDKVTVLIYGKQTALTGLGSQTGSVTFTTL